MRPLVRDVPPVVARSSMSAGTSEALARARAEALDLQSDVAARRVEALETAR